MNQIHIKYFFFLIISLISVQYSFSQSITWQREYKGPTLYNIYGEDVCRADGNNFFLLFRDNHNGNQAIIYKINKYGDSIGYLEYSPRKGYACASTIDGGMIFSGTSAYPYSTKIDANCNLIWDNLYNQYNYSYIVSSIIRSSDNFFILAGEGYLLKINSAGNAIWCKPNGHHYSTNYFNVIEAINGGYLIGGETYEGLSLPTLGLISKTDSAGFIEWEKQYSIDLQDNGLRSLKVASQNNNYYAAGSSFLSAEQRYIITMLKLDFYGNVLDTFKYRFDNRFSYTFTDIKPLSNNRLVISSLKYINYPDSVSSVVFIVDTFGNLVRNQEYTANTGYTQLKRIYVASDNIILLIGKTDNIYPHSVYPFVVKTDSTLYAPPINVNNISQNVPDNFYLNQNYPNPFNGNTQVVFGISKKGNYNLRIYDVTGKLMDVVFSQRFEPGEYRTDINAERFSSGVYFYRLESDGLVITKKFVLLK